ncbi:MAG: hypothetical protein PHQ66_02645 [Candidatus Nanoarchaeia archaeon]|nr:hypothetical protein [Candidatus Nanoarchaeia archaeon]MDD5357734.1 hypothetical protein [Candidatus Nanoarchaeia archaeon]MDD5588653.1 hypothetical protein [Candidatus Nanoarchaeia archaeon]
MVSNLPWKKSRAIIIDVYEAEIVKEAGDYYSIEFHDSNMGITVTEIPKKEFKNWPEKIKKGSSFGIVLYEEKITDDLYVSRIGSWPPEKYWNKRILEN